MPNGADREDTIRWLHISDLHVGASGADLWKQVRRDLLGHLKRTLDEPGGPDLDVVLVTGDLACNGTRSEYDELDRLLDSIRKTAGRDLPVLAVPGNHDVARPQTAKDRGPYRWLRSYRKDDDEDAVENRRHLWQEKDGAPIVGLFTEYAAWWARSGARPGQGIVRTVHPSPVVPGDFSAVLESAGGLRLEVLGLNSAWAQYTGGDFREKIQLEREQLGLVRPTGRAADARTLVLQHHPPDWLHPMARAVFDESIYPPREVTACLFGHMHECRTRVEGLSEERVRAFIQAPSVFGVEHYNTSREDRRFGYGFGEIARSGRIRLRLFERRRLKDGSWDLVPDTSVGRVDADGWLLFRNGDEAAASSLARPVPPIEVHAPVIDKYREWATESHRELSMVGIGADDFHFRLKDVYVSLGLSPRGPSPDPRLKHPRHMEASASREPVDLERLLELAGAGRGTIVLGNPGSGKTTALRKLAYELLEGRGPQLGVDERMLPVFLRARRLSPAMLEGSVEAFIQSELDELTAREMKGIGAALWARGNLLLLVDGLDEIADDTQRAQACRWLEKKLKLCRKRRSRLVVSSRYDGYGDGARLGGFLHVDLRPLTKEQVRALVERWFREARRTLLGPARLAEADALSEKEAQSLIRQIELPAVSTGRLRVMVSTPLLLTILCLVVVRGYAIPRKRVEFYRCCLEVLLERWCRCRSGERDDASKPPPVDLSGGIGLLRTVASHLQRAGRRDDLTSEELTGLVSQQVVRLTRDGRATAGPAEILDWLVRDAAVLAEYSDDRYGFGHLDLQSYLAALALTGAGGAGLTELVEHFGEDWWKETTLLAVALTEQSAFVPLMERVLQTSALLDPDGQALLGDCIEEADNPEPEPFAKLLRDASESPARKAAVLRLWADRREPVVVEAARGLRGSKDVDLRALAARVAAIAEARSVGGPTAGRAYDDSVSEIRFLWVPGGTFEMGAKGLQQVCDPPHAVRVSDLWLGETPVTNAQYGRYLEAAPGAMEPALWRDRRFSSPDQPVVAVSWHDAMGYCQWLRETTGLPAILPSEAQWERAARGDDGRPYPWGRDDPDETRAWFGQAIESQPKLVGGYPAGAGPYGHQDLAGNVWEWCLDVWSEDEYRRRKVVEPLDPIVDAGDADRRALRGGCFINVAQFLRAAVRYWDPAEYRVIFVGFRVALSPASRWPVGA